ncbi:hypothetical protein AVEN_5124-1 [Araneus ventricosus]|uniref:Uncharacterized protein n=1 Tax=Araneus ventricosus TaxID=182803 RepID=A0A4Y2K0C3_ARAVE|nr:hypothetical protein AVEN_5124-1 [Araneus ventricosus]
MEDNRGKVLMEEHISLVEEPGSEYIDHVSSQNGVSCGRLVCTGFIQSKYKFGEWSHKIEKTKDTNKIALLAFTEVAVSQNTLLITIAKHLETVKERLFRIHSKRGCCTCLDVRIVSKAKAFQDSLESREKSLQAPDPENMVDVEEQTCSQKIFQAA